MIGPADLQKAEKTLASLFDRSVQSSGKFHFPKPKSRAVNVLKSHSTFRYKRTCRGSVNSRTTMYFHHCNILSLPYTLIFAAGSRVCGNASEEEMPSNQKQPQDAEPPPKPYPVPLHTTP